MSREQQHKEQKKSEEYTPLTSLSRIQTRFKSLSYIQPKTAFIFPPQNTNKKTEETATSSTNLPEEVQAKMENSFGQDFSDVTIHKDSRQAEEIGAKAYTQGADIHFAPGEYQPQSKEGQELIGHELTHVVQQKQGKVGPNETHGKGLLVHQDVSLEKEADEAGKLASEGKSLEVNTMANNGIQLKPDPKKATDNPIYTKATSFIELIRLIRTAEEKLIIAGHNDIIDRIRIIRGIYYGTSWSMDYSKEKSETRNIGFDLYTASTDRPINPIEIIGESLFKALKETPELKDGNRSLDFGHFIIGLESRSNFTSREMEIPKQGGTGLEAVTWLGDLGGGAGMVSMKRITNPLTKTKNIVFNGAGHDYGALINLEGDIAAYVVAKDSKEPDGPSYPQIKENGYISDSLADYLLKKDGKTSNEYNNRVLNFAQMIGAKVENGSITNKVDLITKLSSKLADFGGMYAVVRMKSSGLASEANYRTASKHIVGVSKEVAEIFVDMLERGIKDPAKPILAVLDPIPSSKGEEYGILKQTADTIALQNSIIKGLKDLQKSIWEWIK